MEPLLSQPEEETLFDEVALDDAAMEDQPAGLEESETGVDDERGSEEAADEGNEEGESEVVEALFDDETSEFSPETEEEDISGEDEVHQSEVIVEDMAEDIFSDDEVADEEFLPDLGESALHGEDDLNGTTGDRQEEGAISGESAGTGAEQGGTLETTPIIGMEPTLKLLDYLKDLSNSLPPEVKRIFDSSDTATRMDKLIDSMKSGLGAQVTGKGLLRRAADVVHDLSGKESSTRELLGIKISDRMAKLIEIMKREKAT